MKYLSILLILVTSNLFCQITIDSAKTYVNKYELGSYSYHQEFIGHKGYGAPQILTSDGGAAIFGDGEDKEGRRAILVKFNKDGKEAWKKSFKPEFDELESQSVIEDVTGNFYVFMLTYNYKKYNGGCERIIYISKVGEILWDKIIGEYGTMNNPICSYIHLSKDGKIELRGHVVKDKPIEGKDPVYKNWDGLLNSKGILTEKIGDVIDWANQDWQKRLKPEDKGRD